MEVARDRSRSVLGYSYMLAWGSVVTLLCTLVCQLCSAAEGRAYRSRRPFEVEERLNNEVHL